MSDSATKMSAAELQAKYRKGKVEREAREQAAAEEAKKAREDFMAKEPSEEQKAQWRKEKFEYLVAERMTEYRRAIVSRAESGFPDFRLIINQDQESSEALRRIYEEDPDGYKLIRGKIGKGEAAQELYVGIRWSDE